MHQPFARLLILAGILLVIIGVIWYFGGHKWSWLGRLPGDFRLGNDNWKVYFPLTTMLLFSLLISVILWLIKKFL